MLNLWLKVDSNFKGAYNLIGRYSLSLILEAHMFFELYI
jgi:hypothetical protein